LQLAGTPVQRVVEIGSNKPAAKSEDKVVKPLDDHLICGESKIKKWAGHFYFFLFQLYEGAYLSSPNQKRLTTGISKKAKNLAIGDVNAHVKI
jgi:hypothetical protein